MILRLRMYQLLLKFSTYVLAPLAYFIGWYIWAVIASVAGRPVQFSLQGHQTIVFFGIFVWAFFAEHYKVTSFDELFRERTGARAASSAGLATFLACLTCLYFIRNSVFPRGLLVITILVLMTLTLILHALFRIAFRSQAHFATPVRVLMIGSDQFAADTAKRLQRISFAPLHVVGHVRLPGQAVEVPGARIYEFEQLLLKQALEGIDEMVVAARPEHFSQIPKIIEVCNQLCMPTKAVLDLGEGVVVREKLFQLGNLQMLDLMSTPTESLDYALVKRAFDVCFSLFVLLVTSPLFAISAILIKLTSKGPVFFVQERIGLSGKPFQMYKFRTMREAPASTCDTEWTTSNGGRKTAVGSFLRKTSLDELPQFINVLRGDMSVVGPRPERPHFVSKFLTEISKYNQRHALRVGITGWAQVNGWRGDTSIEKRIEYDLYYLQNWSFLFDLRIIAMTVVSGLIHRNAY